MSSDSTPKMNEYHYKLMGFERTPGIMSQWSFCIELDFTYAQKLHQRKPKPEYIHRLTQMATAKLNLVTPTENNIFTLNTRPFRFWDDTCLLTNITVEPGNACGLDLEYNEYSSLTKPAQAYSKLTYLPHNVDSIQDRDWETERSGI